MQVGQVQNVFPPLDTSVVQEPFEHVTANPHHRLVRVLVLPVVHRGHPHALEDRRGAHLPGQRLFEARILAARARVEAPRRCGVGGRSVRIGGCLRADEPRLLGSGSGCGTAGPASCGGSSHELALPPPCGRYPRALHVSGAIETPTFATSPASPVAAVFLRLIPAVLARCRAARARADAAAALN